MMRLFRKSGPTFFDVVKKREPWKVSPSYSNGIYGCPVDYSYLHTSLDECGCYEGSDCTECWNKPHVADLSMPIKIKYFNSNLEKLQYIDNKSDWIDLRAAKDILMNEGDFCLIPLGVAMQLPVGYEAHVVPRSSTFKKYGIIQTNHMGVIDNSYNGDNDQWHFPAYAVRKTFINEGDRICQFRIVKNQPSIRFMEVNQLDNSDRQGFGSTGCK